MPMTVQDRIADFLAEGPWAVAVTREVTEAGGLVIAYTRGHSFVLPTDTAASVYRGEAIPYTYK